MAKTIMSGMPMVRRKYHCFNCGRDDHFIDIDESKVPTAHNEHNCLNRHGCYAMRQEKE